MGNPTAAGGWSPTTLPPFHRPSPPFTAFSPPSAASHSHSLFTAFPPHLSSHCPGRGRSGPLQRACRTATRPGWASSSCTRWRSGRTRTFTHARTYTHNLHTPHTFTHTRTHTHTRTYTHNLHAHTHIIYTHMHTHAHAHTHAHTIYSVASPPTHQPTYTPTCPHTHNLF